MIFFKTPEPVQKLFQKKKKIVNQKINNFV